MSLEETGRWETRCSLIGDRRLVELGHYSALARARENKVGVGVIRVENRLAAADSASTTGHAPLRHLDVLCPTRIVHVLGLHAIGDLAVDRSGTAFVAVVAVVGIVVVVDLSEG